MLDLQTATEQLQYVSKDILQAAHDIVQTEGGFVNDMYDSGGATNYGVSLRYALTQGLAFDLNGDGVVDIEDIHLITPEIAEATFVLDFFLNKGLNAVGEGFKLCAFDTSVNAGPHKAVMLIQRTVNHLRGQSSELAAAVAQELKEDGLIGAKTTLASVYADHLIDHALLVNSFCDVRDADYENIVEHNPQDEKFLRGWKIRADAFRVSM